MLHFCYILVKNSNNIFCLFICFITLNKIHILKNKLIDSNKSTIRCVTVSLGAPDCGFESVGESVETEGVVDVSVSWLSKSSRNKTTSFKGIMLVS